MVSGHSGIKRNERANELARKGLKVPMVVPEPALGIMTSTLEGITRKWEQEQNEEYWENTKVRTQAKLLLESKLCDEVTRD